MTVRRTLTRIVMQEDVNFLLTNRIPRRWLTQLVGRISRIEHPLVVALGLFLWRLFGELDLRDARQTRFRSLHECFTRQLKDGARPITADPGLLVSPCDAIVGAMGSVERGAAIQAKGFPYPIADLLPDPGLVRRYQDGGYVTLRLTSGMYHRFHAPYDCRVRRVTYVSGDTWNVNPIALARIERLFCKNERAIIECELPDGALVTLVPVAAILVASLRLQGLDLRLHLKYRGPNVIGCDWSLRKGAPMGWFEHGSTILMFVPAGYRSCDAIRPGHVVRVGEPLFSLPGPAWRAGTRGIE